MTRTELLLKNHSWGWELLVRCITASLRNRAKTSGREKETQDLSSSLLYTRKIISRKFYRSPKVLKKNWGIYTSTISGFKIISIIIAIFKTLSSRTPLKILSLTVKFLVTSERLGSQFRSRPCLHLKSNHHICEKMALWIAFQSLGSQLGIPHLLLFCKRHPSHASTQTPSFRTSSCNNKDTSHRHIFRSFQITKWRTISHSAKSARIMDTKNIHRTFINFTSLSNTVANSGQTKIRITVKKYINKPDMRCPLYAQLYMFLYNLF